MVAWTGYVERAAELDRGRKKMEACELRFQTVDHVATDRLVGYSKWS